MDLHAADLPRGTKNRSASQIFIRYEASRYYGRQQPVNTDINSWKASLDLWKSSFAKPLVLLWFGFLKNPRAIPWICMLLSAFRLPGPNFNSATMTKQQECAISQQFPSRFPSQQYGLAFGARLQWKLSYNLHHCLWFRETSETTHRRRAYHEHMRETQAYHLWCSRPNAQNTSRH